MSHGGFYIPRLFRYMPRELGGLKILDAGSGRGEVAYYLRAFTDRDSTDFRGQPIITALDIHAPSIEFTRRYLMPQIYQEAEVLDLVDVEKWAAGRRWGMAMLLEVPEHIPKEKALQILDQIERVADYILVATPLGDELNQDYGDIHPEFNHVSMWYPEDFERRGYRVWVEDVVQYPTSINYLMWVHRLYRRLRGRGNRVQRKIIAVRNPKGLKMSGGIKWGGLCGK